MLYCIVFAIRDAKKILLRYAFGIGNHQTKSNATKVNRKPINKKGGSSVIAGLAITKPNPKNIGTSAAINESRRVKNDSYIYFNIFAIPSHAFTPLLAI